MPHRAAKLRAAHAYFLAISGTGHPHAWRRARGAGPASRTDRGRQGHRPRAQWRHPGADRRSAAQSGPAGSRQTGSGPAIGSRRQRQPATPRAPAANTGCSCPARACTIDNSSAQPAAITRRVTSPNRHARGARCPSNHRRAQFPSACNPTGFAHAVTGPITYRAIAGTACNSRHTRIAHATDRRRAADGSNAFATGSADRCAKCGPPSGASRRPISSPAGKSGHATRSAPLARHARGRADANGADLGPTPKQRDCADGRLGLHCR